MPFMVSVLFVEVIARYFFNHPTIWAYDLSIFAYGYTGLLAGAYVLKTGDHINVDLVHAKLSPRGQAILELIHGLLIFFFAILVICTTWEPALHAISNHETRPGEWSPPIGHFKLMIPVGGSLILLQQLANWIRSLYRLITGRELRP